MSENKKDLIKKYFNSLVQEFITDPDHQDITIIFKDNLGQDGFGDTLGHTEFKRTGGDEHWETENGVEIPGSRWKEPFKYTYKVTFLNHYKDAERWLGTVAHEFAHLYLFTKLDHKHKHDENFYSHMEKFENWMDKKWGLTPRKDKSGDWDQHVDSNKCQEREKAEQEMRKVECHSCKKRVKTSQLNQNNDCLQCVQQEKSQFNSLVDSLRNSKDLTELESNYQKVKAKYSSLDDNKRRELDDHYQDKKKWLKKGEEFQKNQEQNKKENGDGSNIAGIIGLIILGIVVIIAIYYLFAARRKKY